MRRLVRRVAFYTSIRRRPRRLGRMKNKILVRTAFMVRAKTREECKPDHELPQMLYRPDLPSCRLLAAKHHTSRRRFRDQSVLLIGYLAFNVANGAAPLHNGSFRSELCLPNRAKEIDFQFDGSEGFLRSKGARKRHPHCRISNIAKDSAVQRSHGICMLRSGCQHDRSAPISDLLCLKSNQTRDGYVVDPCSLPKIGFQRNSLSTHELRATPLDFRARTLVSRYSSR